MNHLPATHKSRVAVRPEYPAPTTITSQGEGADETFVAGDMTPIEGTPWARPASGVHWKPSREVILNENGYWFRYSQFLCPVSLIWGKATLLGPTLPLSSTDSSVPLWRPMKTRWIRNRDPIFWTRLENGDDDLCCDTFFLVGFQVSLDTPMRLHICWNGFDDSLRSCNWSPQTFSSSSKTCARLFDWLGIFTQWVLCANPINLGRQYRSIRHGAFERFWPGFVSG